MAGLCLAASLWAEDDAARVARIVQPTTDFSKPEAFELNPGGATTSVASANANAFSHPSANMSFERQLDFHVGNGIFRKLWVSSPASTQSSDGLGPVFNARSCQSCHLKDGRGRPPVGDEPASALFLRLSVPPTNETERLALEQGQAAVIAEPRYGTQLQNFSVQGVPAEGHMEITLEPIELTLADGDQIELLKPTYSVASLGYGPISPDVMLSPRVTPPMIGMGLIEAIPVEAIQALADPDDIDGDGISGRYNRVWDQREDGLALGRFGWKAGQPTVEQQTAHAFAGDLGLSSALVPAAAGDCTPLQTVCVQAPDGRDDQEGVEITQQMLELVTFYASHLAVPARRDIDDPDVLAGKKHFYDAGCTGCHRPKFVTRRDSVHPEHSFQLIWPYSDFLLHDMGDGLADDRPEAAADGREWRTPPLWGVGLTATVNGHSRFLHDGRARGLLEAILWHGGEAEQSKRKVVAMSREHREQLLAFLRSL